MDELGDQRLTPEVLRRELDGLEARIDARFDLKLQLLEERTDRKLAQLEARLLERMNDQTKTIFRTLVVSNSAMVLAVATLAFGAARLA